MFLIANCGCLVTFYFKSTVSDACQIPVCQLLRVSIAADQVCISLLHWVYELTGKCSLAGTGVFVGFVILGLKYCINVQTGL